MSYWPDPWFPPLNLWNYPPQNRFDPEKYLPDEPSERLSYNQRIDEPYEDYDDD